MVKKRLKKQVRKIAFNLLKPFLPYIIVIGILFFAICSLVDAIFIQEVQTSDMSMPKEQLDIKHKCIDKSEYLNTCHNYRDGKKVNYLLDMDNREDDKLIQWSHLYAIMAFHNMTNNAKINESLLNEVAKEFESTFKYEKVNLIIETKTKDNKGNEIIETKEETTYVLVESDSIIGHYKYNYEEKTITNGNTKTTGKAFINEEIIGEKYERLSKYLKDKLHIEKSEIDKDVQIVVQAANRIL